MVLVTVRESLFHKQADRLVKSCLDFRWKNLRESRIESLRERGRERQ